jgi:hypothetical protein
VGADGPDVATGVVTVAPIHFEPLSREMDRWPETKSNHADMQNEWTIPNLRTHQSAVFRQPARPNLPLNGKILTMRSSGLSPSAA